MLLENYKAAIILDMHGYSNVEITNILECKLHNVKARLNRGRKKLKEILGNECGFYHDERNALCWMDKFKMYPFLMVNRLSYK